MDITIYATEIAFDAKSSYMQGPRFGPARIREELCSSAYNPFSESLDKIVNDQALIFTERIYGGEYHSLPARIRKLLRSGHPQLFLGGDHSITYPIVKALRTVHGDFHILHFDSHGDLYDELQGDRYSHGCPFARIMEEELALSLTQVGLRAMTPHQMEQIANYDISAWTMDRLGAFKPDNLKGPLYLSIDLDVLDPSEAPGVSHREAGGLSVRKLLGILSAIKVSVIGADIVEYNPLRDPEYITAATGAKIMREVAATMRRTRNYSQN